MGVYSTNRISSVAESTVTTPVEEEFEYTPNDNLGSVIEAAIGLRENEHNMFNSLIELDFVSATNEATMLEADAEAANNAQNQSKLKAIIDKIEQLFETAIKTIQTAASNFIGKIKELLDRDKKIVEAYKNIKVEDLKGFKGISNFAFPTGKIPDLKSITNAESEMNKILDTIKNASDRDTVDQYAETAKTKASEIKDSLKREDFFEKKVESFVPTQDQLNRMIQEVTNAKDTVAEIKKLTTSTMSTLKATKSKARAAIHDSKEELEVYKAKTVYKASSELVNGYMKMFNEVTHVFTSQIAAYRKALIICGRYAKKGSNATSDVADDKKENDTDVTESVLLYSLAESSDDYVYGFFAY